MRASNAPLSSVLVRTKDVFAANEEGVFRASLVEKKWRRLPLPKGMPANGQFGRVPKGSKHLLYVAPRTGLGKGCGLYDSTDAGASWRLLSRAHDFQNVYLHNNGSLYAIIVRTIEKDGHEHLRWSILRAEGVAAPPKWVDVTGGLGAGVMLHDVFQDPDHPDLICLTGECIRGYVIHASDKNYRWKMTRAWEWRKQPETDDSFLTHGYGTQSALYLLHATLANYFQHPFGGQTNLGAFTIQTSQASFTFSKDQPKVVPLAIHFLPEKGSVRLLDLGEGHDFWGIQVVTPTGKRVSRAAKGSALELTREKAQRLYRGRKDLVSVVVEERRPYRRRIDLGRLFDFSAPGTYKVLLSYDNVWLADPEKEWAGYFGGQVFTVVVR